jgi:hypothetical protein
MFHIITRCSRVNNLDKIRTSIYSGYGTEFKWHIVFDVSRLKDIPAELLGRLNNDETQ